MVWITKFQSYKRSVVIANRHHEKVSYGRIKLLSEATYQTGERFPNYQQLSIILLSSL